MKARRSGWPSMIGFIVTLVVLLVAAGAGSRGAWSFSVDVPSPVLASITGGAPPAAPSTAAGQPGATAPAGGNAANAPSPLYPTMSPAEPGATPDNNSTPQPTVKKGSNWPTIILATVLVLGGILIVLYFITRNRDD